MSNILLIYASPELVPRRRGGGGSVAGDVRARPASRPGQGPDQWPYLGARAVRGGNPRARVQPARRDHQPAPGLPGTGLGAAPVVAGGGAARGRPGAVLRGVLVRGGPAV